MAKPAREEKSMLILSDFKSLYGLGMDFFQSARPTEATRRRKRRPKTDRPARAGRMGALPPSGKNSPPLSALSGGPAGKISPVCSDIS